MHFFLSALTIGLGYIPHLETNPAKLNSDFISFLHTPVKTSTCYRIHPFQNQVRFISQFLLGWGSKPGYPGEPIAGKWIFIALKHGTIVV
jgi:hypothetical protein